MKLLIVRHAKAEERNAASWPDDSARPLTAKGADQFRKSAQGLQKLITPDTLLTSPYTRARQTAGILHEVAGWPEPEETEALAEDVPELVALVKRHAAQSPGGTLAVVGHEPTLSEAISMIVSGNPRSRVQMQPGAAALLDVTGAAPGGLSGSLTWLAQPKMTRAMA